MKRFVFLLAIYGYPGPAQCGEPDPAGVAFFENKIRPVLAENCYQCHNSVDKKKGDIALDYRAALIEAEVVVPGKPEESALMGAIRHEADFEPMPSKSPKLANLIVKNFEDWIRMGAPDPRLEKPTKEQLESEVDWDSVREQRKQWWSFQPVKKVSPPAADEPAWDGNAIDRFVFGGLKANALKPQAVAAPNTLVRRLHLILTGLPPEPEVVDAFVADPSEAAYGKLVQELMASEAYGERWGRFWMDWFRYAESHGSEGDPAVPYATQYRDYIIRAINADVPYDQLVREHLAGDLLENPRVNEGLGLNESAIGPSHLRMVPHGFGVTDAYGEQVTYVDNQVDVVSKAILGVTVSCARCHNHKFDPISQKDFYKLYGIMVSSRPAIVNVDSPELQALHKREIAALKEKLRVQFGRFWHGEVDAAITALGGAKLDKVPDTDPLAAWAKLKDTKPGGFAKPLAEMRRRHEDALAHNAEAKANATFYADLREGATYDRWFRSGNGLGDKVSPAGSFALAGEGDRAFTGIYPAGVYSHLISDKHNGFLNSVFHLAEGERNQVRAIGNGATARFCVRSYPLIHGGLHPAPGLNGELGWTNLNKYKYWNGEQGYYQINTGADKTVGGEGGPERSWFGVLEVYAGSDSMREVGAPIVALAGGLDAVDDRDALLALYRETLSGAVAAWTKGEPSDEQALFLHAFVARGLLPQELGKLPAELKSGVDAYRKLEAAIRKPVRATGVVDAQPWDQPMLERGDYKKEGDPVPRAFLEAFPGEPYRSGSGRRELAEDMLAANNPLTARVIANRLWHHTFGRGLVASNDNFGRLGEEPTHPELLDHLAHELRAGGWSMKGLVRKLVMSRTFRSASKAPAASAENDPANRYLAHFTPRRLDAEAILDSIRFVAHNSIDRRAVYTRAKRNRLDPFLKTFNYPIPTTTVGVRDLTNVPAQALTLMNGNITRDSARGLSQRIKSHPEYGSDTERIEALFKQAYAREPGPEELAASLQFLSGKAEDPTARLAAQHTEFTRRLATARDQREAIVAPVRTKLQAELDKKQAGGPKPVDLKPIARWDFEGDANDQVGGMHGQFKGKAKVEGGALVLDGGMLATAPLTEKLRAKTLEVVVQLDPIGQSKGGAMTLQATDGNTFDGIVYAEMSARTWMAGSNHHRRTRPFEAPQEEGADKRPVRMLFTYTDDGTVTAYRDGQAYGKPYKTEVMDFAPGNSQVVFGTRHGTNPSPGRALTGKIFEARLYDRALTAAEAAAASSGTMREIVGEPMVVASLDDAQRERLGELDAEIATLSTETAKLQRSLEEANRVKQQAGDAWFRLAHAILNSKELIYVH